MNDLNCASLGETWLKLVERTVRTGVSADGESLELLGVPVAFPAEVAGDALIRQFGDSRMMAEIDRVFFADGSGALGHSYARLMHGPDGRPDLTDVISLLRAEPATKRAVVTLCGPGGGQVPCVNTVQFLVRAGSVRTLYFARGQDAFKKFYADGLCLAEMGRRVADGLDLPAGTVSGFIGSSHVYQADLPAVELFLASGHEWLRSGRAKGVH
jgi:thymidylate synthase